MELKAQAAELLAAISSLGQVVNKNSILKICECIKFDVFGSVLTLTASDLENTISTKAECVASEDFAFCIPFEDIKSILTEVRAGEIKITYTIKDGVKATKGDQGLPEAHILSFVTLIGKNSLSGLSAIDFPTTPDIDTGSFRVDGDFATALFRAIKYTHQNKDIFAQTGVLVEGIGGKVRCIATNGSLVSASKEIELPIECRTILPKKTCSIVWSLFADGADLKITDKGIWLSNDTHTLYGRALDAHFPKWQTIIPDYSDSCVLDREQTLRAVRFSLISADASTKMMAFEISDGAAYTSATDFIYNREGRSERLPLIKNSIPDFKIGFNGEWLVKIISDSPDDSIVIESYGDPTRGVILRDATGGYTLLMPMML